VHIITRAGLSGIPVIGSPAAEIFSAIIIPPLSKRRDKWVEEIAKRLVQLENKFKDFKIDDLATNKMFITIFVHASQIAIRNHHEEKLEALRNAILNSALPNPPEEDLQLMFLNFVDLFTTWHIRILMFLNKPIAWAEKQGVRLPLSLEDYLGETLEIAFPELKGKKDFYTLIENDLDIRKLISIGNPRRPIAKPYLPRSLTTDIGKQFIKFITPPIE
jgi:hypothetical protein